MLVNVNIGLVVITAVVYLKGIRSVENTVTAGSAGTFTQHHCANRRASAVACRALLQSGLVL